MSLCISLSLFGTVTLFHVALGQTKRVELVLHVFLKLRYHFKQLKSSRDFRSKWCHPVEPELTCLLIHEQRGKAKRMRSGTPWTPTLLRYTFSQVIRHVTLSWLVGGGLLMNFPGCGKIAKHEPQRFCQWHDRECSAPPQVQPRDTLPLSFHGSLGCASSLFGSHFDVDTEGSN